MAPRGKSRGVRDRETRHSALNEKASSRGGISKRGGRNKIDDDGDLDMDVAARRSKANGPKTRGQQGRGGTRSGPTRDASKAAKTIENHLSRGNTAGARIVSGPPPRSTRSRLTYLRVHGLRASKAASNPDGGLKNLLEFLERKASAFTPAPGSRKKNVMIKKSHVAGDYVFIGTSKEDADEIIKLNNFNFAGATLEIVESNEDIAPQNKVAESAETSSLRQMLKSILEQRYAGDTKLLKLDALASDAALVKLGSFENRERALKTFKGLMAICDTLFQTAQAKQDAIESISLANNNIDDVTQVESVAVTFPHLRNLDMSGNHIRDTQGLSRWKGKFRDLVTIYTTGNPIESTDTNFPATLLEWFPKLQNINGVQLRTPEQIAQQIEARRPKAIPQRGPDFRDVNGIGENFLLNFFGQYDTSRQSLIAGFYDEKSQFSVAIDTRSVRDSDGPAPLPWSSYIKVSRNLLKITTHNARQHRLSIGAENIWNIWKDLPATVHPAIKENLSKYIMDCHKLSGLVDPNGQDPKGVDGLILCVHGEFDEYESRSGLTGKRSFSRTFVLGPGMAGRGPIRVVSDMLSLRAFSKLPNVFDALAQGQPQPQSQPPPANPSAQDQQQAMIAELCRQTGMNAQYSRMCLEQVGWAFERALTMFNQKRAELGPEAFAQQ